MKKKSSNNGAIQKSILRPLSGTIEGLVLTKKGVIYIKQKKHTKI